MTRINLLPWREELRSEQRRQFAFITVGAIILMLLGLTYSHIHINGLKTHQAQRNALLEDEIKELDGKIQEITNLNIEKKELLARMDIIQELQGNRHVIVHIFDELVNQVPKGVYLDSFTQTGDNIEIEGQAQSNARISSFMRNLEQSLWLEDPQLEVIESKGGRFKQASRFILHVKRSASPEAGERK